MADKFNSEDKRSTLTLGAAGKLGVRSARPPELMIKTSRSSSATVEIRRKKRIVDSSTTTEQPGIFTGSVDGSLTAREQASRFNALQNAAAVVKEHRDKQAHELPKHDLDDGMEPTLVTTLEHRDTTVADVTAEDHAAPQVAPIDAKPEDVAKKTKKYDKNFDVDEKAAPKKSAPPQKTIYQKHVKLAVEEALSSDSDDLTIGKKASAPQRKFRPARRHRVIQVKRDKLARKVMLPTKITVQELASRMAEKAKDVQNVLLKEGKNVKLTDCVDVDTATYLIEHFGHSFKLEKNDNLILENNDDGIDCLPRPPVVTIMGHVDHGKTSLLDSIRQADIAGSEFGGITQHIGAYQVTKNGRKITFIDTPGHEAFTSMRARGANITDIVILVVAVDDGIMAQTIEAISHVRAAGVPVIVAINKMDKPKSDITKIRDNLLQHSLIAEELGGDVMLVPVSAKEKMNLDKLEDTVLLIADLLELTAPVDCRASGVVIESKVDKSRGVLTTVIVQKGTLRVGDIVVAGHNSYGKVRAMINENGVKEAEVLPATPIEILGLSGVPMSGDNFVVVESEKQARELLSYRSNINLNLKDRIKKEAQDINDLFVDSSHKEELNVLLKCDVVGSMEAIFDSITKLTHDDLELNVLHKAVGNVTDSDVLLADASKAVILAFNVNADNKIRDFAKQKNVDIRYYSIIYELIDDVRSLLNGLLKPAIQEVHIGTAIVKEVFTSTRHGTVIGCQVSHGLIKRGASLKLLRNAAVIYEGKLKTLRRFKEDVKEVKSGFECGIMLELHRDAQVGDVVKTFDLVEEARSIS